MTNMTTKLSLPLIQPSQAQKHVTHNEAIRALDVLTQLGVVADDLSSPPAAAAEGDSYIVAAGGTSAWAGHDGELATFQAGTWQFLSPRTGWRAHVAGRGALVVYDGAQWFDFSPTELQNVSRIGLGGQATAANPFSAKLNAALWDALTVAEGGTGGMVQSMNKESAADDAGVALQTGFTTKALIGLFGSELLRLSVSADGSSFLDGLVIDPGTGIAEQPQLPRFKASTNFDNWVAADSWVKIGINATEYNAQAAFNAATSLFTAPVDGCYLLGASLGYKRDAADPNGMRGRLVQNGTVQISGSYGEATGALNDGNSVMWLQTVAVLTAGDTVELQGQFTGSAGFFLAGNTTFWGCKIG